MRQRMTYEEQQWYLMIFTVVMIISMAILTVYFGFIEPQIRLRAEAEEAAAEASRKYTNATKEIVHVIKDVYKDSVQVVDSQGTYTVVDSADMDYLTEVKLECVTYMRENRYDERDNLKDVNLAYTNYVRVTSVDPNEVVLFEFESQGLPKFAISEASESICDYSAKYPYMFTLRDDTVSEFVRFDCAPWTEYYKGHKTKVAVVRVWVYDMDLHEVRCIKDMND